MSESCKTFSWKENFVYIALFSFKSSEKITSMIVASIALLLKCFKRLKMQLSTKFYRVQDIYMRLNLISQIGILAQANKNIIWIGSH